MYLLDTNVVSEFRRARPHGAVLQWIADIPREDLFVSAFTIGEIQVGIETTRDQDPGRAEELEAWLDIVLASYRFIPMTADIFREWARLKHRKSPSLAGDAMIAATARVNDLIVVTRNARDFTELGVDSLNPFETR